MISAISGAGCRDLCRVVGEYLAEQRLAERQAQERA